MSSIGALRLQLESLAASAQTGADALADAGALDLGDGTLEQMVAELQTLDGRLALLLDRLATAADPVGVGR
jgi:hypothetical protein